MAFCHGNWRGRGWRVRIAGRMVGEGDDAVVLFSYLH